MAGYEPIPAIGHKRPLKALIGLRTALFLEGSIGSSDLAVGSWTSALRLERSLRVTSLSRKCRSTVSTGIRLMQSVGCF